MAALSKYRLSGDIKPLHYDLIIKTDVQEAPTFDAWVNAKINILKATPNVELNIAGELRVDDFYITTASGEVLKADGPLEVDPDREIATATFPRPLEAGESATLSIRFGKVLKQSFQGYFCGTWKREAPAKDLNYACSFFAPTYARQFFPCWDEPTYKATFSVTMISRDDYVNISNMPAISEEPYDPANHDPSSQIIHLLESHQNSRNSVDAETSKWKITRFDKTPPMSTYLLVFATGPFEHIETSYVSPLSGKTRPLRFYSTPDVVQKGKYCLDISARALAVYEKLFDIEYPLPKLDTLAIPEGGSGAMENWGLILSGSEIALLDEKRGDAARKRKVGFVQAHEVAHQWFGNIVTLKWWDNTWLNEGFATLIGEMIGMARIEPTWDVYTEFVKKINVALDLDSKRSSHPVQLHAESPGEIGQAFDQLSYSKAASVLRMLVNCVGEETFLKGVSIYLKQHLYGNATAEDLWDGISTAAGMNVSELQRAWILETGYPVIRVTETEDTVSVRQDRFLQSGEPTDAENQTVWQIPLFSTFKTETGETVFQRDTLLKERSCTLSINPSRPYLINSGNRGCYRVIYPSDRLKKIAESAQDKDTLVEAQDRIQLLGDSLAFAPAGLVKTSDVLELCNAFRWEDTYMGCFQLSSAVGAVRDIFWEDNIIYEGLSALIRAIFSGHVERLGFEERPTDTDGDSQLRVIVIESLANANESTVVAQLLTYFEAFMNTRDPSHIPKDLIPITLQTGVSKGGTKEWEFMLDIYQDKDPQFVVMKPAVIQGLTASKDPKTIQRTLELIPEVVGGNALLWFFRFLTKRVGIASRRATTQFILDKFDMIEGQLSPFMMPVMINGAFDGLSSLKDANTMEAVFLTKDTSNFAGALSQAIEAVRTKAAWLQSARNDVKGWLEQNGYLSKHE